MADAYFHAEDHQERAIPPHPPGLNTWPNIEQEAIEQLCLNATSTSAWEQAVGLLLLDHLNRLANLEHRHDDLDWVARLLNTYRQRLEEVEHNIERLAALITQLANQEAA